MGAPGENGLTRPPGGWPKSAIHGSLARERGGVYSQGLTSNDAGEAKNARYHAAGPYKVPPRMPFGQTAEVKSHGRQNDVKAPGFT